MSEKPISPLRRRMIEEMTVRNFVEKTRNDYIRHVRSFTAFLGRSPDTATPEDLRRFQLHQTQTGVRAPSNGSVAQPGQCTSSHGMSAISTARIVGDHSMSRPAPGKRCGASVVDEGGRIGEAAR